MPTDVERLTQENAELRARLENLQQQLMQSQKLGAIGALSSSITHEFNNILMTVINYAKMGMRHRDPTTRDKAFDRILNAGQRASKITTGMLAFARAKGDRREPLSLAQLTREVLVLVEKDLQVHRVQLATNLLDDPYAEVNAGQVQQVLLNLIINARQAMPNGGVLTITVHANDEDQMAEVAIRDTGSGIPADKLPHIFKAFYSTKTVDAQGQGGTGLGLAMCKDVIDSHRGRIRVESAEGEGTCFTLRFPQVPRPNLMATAGTPVPALAAAGR